MNTQYSTTIKKILAPIVFVVFPIVLIRDALRAWHAQTPFSISNQNISEYVSRQFMFNMVSGDILAILLFTIFSYFVWRKYRPRTPLGLNAASTTWALGLSLGLFAVVGIASFLTDGLMAPRKSLPFLPGAGFLPLLAVLCLGVIEAVRDRIREPNIWLVVFLVYMFCLFVESVSFLPFTYFFQPSLNLGVKTPLFFVSDSVWQWWAYLPSAIIIISCLIYLRLGLVPMLAFVVSHVLFWWLASLFGLDSNPVSMGYWIAFALVAGFAYKKCFSKTPEIP